MVNNIFLYFLALFAVAKCNENGITVEVPSTETSMTVNYTSAENSNSNMKSNATNAATSMATTEGPNCTETGDILCTIYLRLHSLGHPNAVLGVGVTCIVVVIVFVAVAAVCCDRKCRKRNSPQSTSSQNGTEKKVNNQTNPGVQKDEHPYYNEAAAIVGNQQPRAGEVALYSAVYDLADQIPGESGMPPGPNGDGPYADITEVSGFQVNQSKSNTLASAIDETGFYQDTAVVKKDLAAFHLPPSVCIYAEAKRIGPTDSSENLAEETNVYDGALAVNAAKAQCLEAEYFQDQRECEDEVFLGRGHGHGHGRPQFDEDAGLVDSNIYCNSERIGLQARL